MSWGRVLNWFKPRARAERAAEKIVASPRFESLPPDHWDALRVAPAEPTEGDYWEELRGTPRRESPEEVFKRWEEQARERKRETPEELFKRLEEDERAKEQARLIYEEMRRIAEDKERERALEEEGRRIAEKIRREEEARAARESDEIPSGTLEDSRKYANARAGTPRDSADEWIATGYYRLIQSEGTVYAARYDLQTGKLYVQYKHWDPSMELGTQQGPGPVYEYSDVSPAEARAFYNAPSAGVWLWDNVRIRGSWALHQKPYRIVAISRGYLPRKAVHDYKGSGQEWFVPRSAWGPNGRAVASQLPLAPAPPISYDGTPMRGTPNRGRPNNGRPKK